MAQNHVPITAPPATPPVYSLVGALRQLGRIRAALPDGWVFDPEQCPPDRGGIEELDCEGNTSELLAEDNPGLVAGDSFIVWAADRCSTLGWKARDYVGRAQRQLAAVESYFIAQAFAEGPGYLTQHSLDDAAATVVSSATGVDVASGLVLLEAALAEAARGQQAMIHVTMGQLDRLAEANMITRDAGLWRTANGNVVIADAGYSGAGPDGADGEWIYATSMIELAMGEPEIIPGTLETAQAWAQAMNRAINDVEVRSQRIATFVWDECVHLAVRVDSTVGAAAGGGGGGEAFTTSLAAPGSTDDIGGTVGYFGFSLRSTVEDDTVTVINLYDGDETDVLIEVINLAPGETAREFYPAGIPIGGSLQYRLLSGSAEGTLRLNTEG